MIKKQNISSLAVSTLTIVSLCIAFHTSTSAAQAPPSFIATWGTSGSDPGEFDTPTGVATDSLNRILIADGGNHRIQQFTADGDFVTEWGTLGSSNGQFNSPRDVAVAPDGSIYVADANNHRMQKFDSVFTFLLKWGTRGSGSGQFEFPWGIAVDEMGNVFVADTGNHRIQKFSANGVFLTEWGTLGTAAGQFDLPYDVDTDNSGTVCVADLLNDRIQGFDYSGTFLAQWGSTGNGPGQFHEPYAVDCTESGTVYVADSRNARFQKFTSSGQFLLEWGIFGTDRGEFNDPRGVVTATNGDIYALDSFNDRVQVFRAATISPFLRVPVCKENDFSGGSCSSSVSGIHSWVVTAILDHSGSYYQADGTVKAFVTDLSCTGGAPCIGEVANGSNTPPAGYRLDCAGTPVDFGDRLNYVGVDAGDSGQCGPPTGNTAASAYINYDGHSGYDLDTTFGDVVLAAAAGILEFPPSPDAVIGNASSFNALRIRHSNGLESWYLHTQPGSECDLVGLCTGGQSVEVHAGQAIALAGNTGLGCGPCTADGCSCDHLHFEVRFSISPTEVIDPFGCGSEVAAGDPIRCSSNRLWLDEIFADGFEAGDFTAWSTTVP